MRIENHKLWYFKSETDPLKANLGSVSLEAVDWVRPFDNSDGMQYSFFLLAL